MQYSDLMKKKTIVEKDKAKIAELIAELDQKKKEALASAWKKVNKASELRNLFLNDTLGNSFPDNVSVGG